MLDGVPTDVSGTNAGDSHCLAKGADKSDSLHYISANLPLNNIWRMKGM